MTHSDIGRMDKKLIVFIINMISKLSIPQFQCLSDLAIFAHLAIPMDLCTPVRCRVATLQYVWLRLQHRQHCTLLP